MRARVDRHGGGAAGFTLVEVLIVMAVVLVGFLALMNLQIGTLQATAQARDLQGALSLARHFGETLRLEALNWTPTTGGSPSSIAGLRYLNKAPANTTPGTASGWIVAYPAGADGDARVGVAGADATYDAGVLQEVGRTLNAHYCVHYRLTWIVKDLLLRADVRVMWARAGGDFGAYAQCPLGMEDKLQDVFTVTVPFTIMRNVFVRQV